jgi:hypothetical protein
MDIGVDEPDLPARRLYESLGFSNREGGDGPLMYVYERDPRDSAGKLESLLRAPHPLRRDGERQQNPGASCCYPVGGGWSTVSVTVLDVLLPSPSVTVTEMLYCPGFTEIRPLITPPELQERRVGSVEVTLHA